MNSTLAETQTPPLIMFVPSLSSPSPLSFRHALLYPLTVISLFPLPWPHMKTPPTHVIQHFTRIHHRTAIHN